jgi:hypothetical protein
MNITTDYPWFSVRFIAGRAQTRLSVISVRPWAYRLWNEAGHRLVSEGVLSLLTDLPLDAAGKWRLEVATEGLIVEPTIRRRPSWVGIDLLTVLRGSTLGRSPPLVLQAH